MTFLAISNDDIFSAIEQAAVVTGNTIRSTKVKSRRSGASEIFTVTLNREFKFGGDVVYPTITWRNVNDGKHAATFNFGVYRLVCTNGLMMPVEGIDTMDLRIIHRDCKPTHQKLSTLLDNLIAAYKRIDAYMAALAAKEAALTAPVDNVVALKIIRGMGLSKRVTQRAESTLANPKREEDATGTLWALFNIVQEEMMTNSRGGAAAEVRNMKLYETFAEQAGLKAA